jgi:hypothetical protein
MSVEINAIVEDWQREAARMPIDWTGDLHDGTVVWAGLMLRAEQMDRRTWWWAVYDERTGDVLGGATRPELMASNGEKARAAAESVAREWLSTGLLPNQAFR